MPAIIENKTPDSSVFCLFFTADYLKGTEVFRCFHSKFNVIKITNMHVIIDIVTNLGQHTARDVH